MKTKLITREGYNKPSKAEHDHLWHEKRPEITKIVTLGCKPLEIVQEKRRLHVQ